MAEPRILIQGIGGIGGIMAARLLGAGFDAVLVTGNRAITEAINGRGVRVRMGGKEIAERARAFTSLDELPPIRFDLSLLVMKAHTVVEAARGTIRFLEDWGYVVTCQNGVVEDAVAAAVGRERVVSAIVAWGGTMHAPGEYEKTGPGKIHIGEIDGHASARIRGLAEVLEHVSPIVMTNNIRGSRWSKLAINCVITTMGALSGRTLGEMLESREMRDLALVIFREVVDTADALSIKLEWMAAPPRLLYLPAGSSPLARRWKDLLVRIVGRRYGKLRSSMLQSLERGRRTEIDFLNGYVVEKARQAGVDVPVNEALVRMIKEIESGARRIGIENARELARLATAARMDPTVA